MPFTGSIIIIWQNKCPDRSMVVYFLILEVILGNYYRSTDQPNDRRTCMWGHREVALSIIGLGNNWSLTIQMQMQFQYPFNYALAFFNLFSLDSSTIDSARALKIKFIFTIVYWRSFIYLFIYSFMLFFNNLESLIFYIEMVCWLIVFFTPFFISFSKHRSSKSISQSN